MPRASPRAASAARRLWLEFLNTDAGPPDADGRRDDVLVDFARWVAWLEAAGGLETDRARTLIRRAEQQPAGATAALVDARRLRAALRQLAERAGAAPTPEAARAIEGAVAEVNRVLARSAGTRRLEVADGGVRAVFVPGGDAFAALLLPVAESAAAALTAEGTDRVKRCAGRGCSRVFLDATRNGTRRWCAMAGCGNREKQRRHRGRAG